MLKYLNQMISNFPLICAMSGWLVAQVLKVFTGIFRLRKFNVIELLFGTGGMPSSHSCAVCSLTVAIALSQGFDSPVFALSLLFSIIVMRDATGVRREAGEQAKVLNRIMQDLFESSDQNDFDRSLKELIGHTPLQVAVGAAVGCLIPFAVAMIPAYRWVLFG